MRFSFFFSTVTLLFNIVLFPTVSRGNDNQENKTGNMILGSQMTPYEQSSGSDILDKEKHPICIEYDASCSFQRGIFVKICIDKSDTKNLQNLYDFLNYRETRKSAYDFTRELFQGLGVDIESSEYKSKKYGQK